MFYRINTIEPLPDMRLLVRFYDSSVKYYDVKPLIQKYPAFASLEIPFLFRQVRVDEGGYGISWNDQLDISCNELWENGTLNP